MSRLTRLSLASRAVVLLMAVIVIVAGIIAARSLKQELIPSIETPRLSVVTIFPGATPETVEREVSKPLEDAVKGVAGVTAVTSRSASGVSQVRVDSEFGENAERIQNQIRTAVASTKSRLPNDLNPDVFAGSFDDVPVVALAVSSGEAKDALARKVKDTVVPRLKLIPGVRDVAVTGEDPRQVVITLRPDAVERYGVSVATLPAVFQAAGAVIPAGTLPGTASRLDVQVGRTLTSVADVQHLQVQGQDGPVELSRIADVREQLVDTTSISRANGKPSLVISVTKEPAGNTVSVSQGVRQALPALSSQLGSSAAFSTVFDQSPYIENSVHDLSVEGGLGLVFAVLVILLFLGSLRSTLITAISIPLSLLVALVGLWSGGYTLNILTLGALTVAIGRVVDDSIVVVENIERHHAMGRHGAGDIVAAVREVAGAVTSSTLTTVAVFLPIGMVSGQTGALFRPFAVTVTICLLASLLVSLTVVPVLASWFLRTRVGSVLDPTPSADRRIELDQPPTRLQRSYLPVLDWARAHRVLTLVIATAVFAGTMALAPHLKTDFIGNAGDSTLRVTQRLPVGANLAQTDAASKRLEAVVAADPAVESYQTTVGGDPTRARFGVVSGSNQAALALTLKAGSKSDQVADRLRRQMHALPEIGVVEVVGSSSGTSEVAVRVESPDPAKLRAGSDAVVASLRRIEGLGDVKSDLTDETPMLSVDIDPAAAARAGMAQTQVGLAVTQAIRGTKVGTVILPTGSLDLILRSREPIDTAEQLRALPLPVTMKQDTDAKKAAASRVEERQKAAARRQQDEAAAASADQERQLIAGRAKAAEQAQQVAAKVAALQAQIAAISTGGVVTDPTRPQLPSPTPGATLGPNPTPGPTLGPDSTVVPTPGPDPAAALKLQLAQLQAAQAQAQAQVGALDKQLAGLRSSRAAVAQRTAEAQELQQAAKDAGAAKGSPLLLADVATVRQVVAPASIGRVDGARSATVTAMPTGSDLGGTTAKIRTELAALRLPDGVSVHLGGVSQAQQDSFSQLGVAMLAAIAIVYLIMVATFGSLLQPLILLVSVPFAATGAIGLLLVTDTPLGVPAMIGLLMLIGIVVTNAIVLIDLINQYRGAGMSLDEAVRGGARLRLRPIVMTALATICALLPMGLGVTGGGIFISRPLAIVVIGGLISSTVLTLILVPVLYDLLGRLRQRRSDRPRRADRSDRSPGGRRWRGRGQALDGLR